MNAIMLLREQLKDAHETMEATMADVTSESAHFTNTNKALPVGAAYAHCVLSEDSIVSGMLLHTTPLAEGNVKTGVSVPMPSQAEWVKHEEWVKTVKVDLPVLRKFAQDVYKATDAYIASLSETDLDKPLEITGMGPKTVGYVISNFVILHIANLTGEVSAIKGVQGLKGYPF